jgi:hypothetical protein
LLIGLMAVSQGRSFVSWSWAAALFSPFVVILLFILPSPKPAKQPPATREAVRPPRLPAAARANLSRRVFGLISRRKMPANFAAAVEIDQGIAAVVRDEFSNEPADRLGSRPRRARR